MWGKGWSAAASARASATSIPSCGRPSRPRAISAGPSKTAWPYDPDGLAAVYAGGGFHYVRADGRQLPVITFDNGPDYVVEGLVRGRVGARIGYFDTQLRQVFPATFDFGWAFDDGVARVCQGCRPGTPDDHGHIAMVGGTWYRIDRQGRPAMDADAP